MTGSLQIKNGKYYIVLNTYTDGKRKPTWISTEMDVKGNKRKALQMLDEKKREYDLKNNLVTSDILFSEYIKHWLEIQETRVSTVTWKGYGFAVNRHVVPYFENLKTKLCDINHVILQAYIDKEYQSGRIDGNGRLSPKSIRMIGLVIHRTLKEAMKNNLISNNPCDLVEMPKLEKYKNQIYTKKELDDLFEAINDDPLYPLIKTTLVYGLRRSEVLGLKWDSVNFDTNTFIIQHTVTQYEGIYENDKTKNKSSYRSFPLTDEVKAIFLKAKEKQDKNRSLFGNQYVENNYIFKWENGKQYEPNYITKRFSKLLKMKNLTHIRFHDLRHSCASYLVNNVDNINVKDVQDWLGHSSIQTTLDIYTHLEVEKKKVVAQSMASI